MAVPASHVIELGHRPQTLQSYLLDAERATRSDGARTLSWVISAISSAAKASPRAAHGRLDGALGKIGQHNVQGEEQQALDVIANLLLIAELESREGVVVLGSRRTTS